MGQDGKTPFHIACGIRKLEGVQYLAEKCAVNMNAVDKVTRVPMMCECVCVCVTHVCVPIVWTNTPYLGFKVE